VVACWYTASAVYQQANTKYIGKSRSELQIQVATYVF